MRKIKFIIIPIVFLLISVLVVCFGFGQLNILPVFNIKELIGLPASVPVDIKDNSEIIDELKLSVLCSDTQRSVPVDMNALWIDIGIDLSADAQQGTEAVKYAIYSDFDFYRNFIPDTVFIVPDTKGKFDGLKEPDGTDFDVLAYMLYYVKHIGCSAVLVIDDSFVNNDGINFDTVADYLDNYSFTGILMSIDTSYGNSSYVNFAEEINAFIRKKYPDKTFGVEMHSDFDALFADKFVSEVFEKKLVDFGYVDLGCTTENKNFPFESVALWWSYFGEHYEIPLYCEHRLDMVFSDDKEWGLSTEINSQIESLYDCAAFNGSCYYRSSALKNKKALARDLAILLNDVSGTDQDSFYVSSLMLDSGKVTFSGETASENISVFCNGKYVRSENKHFEKALILKPGMNEFKFTADAASYEYDVYNNASLFNSYYPSENLSIGTDFAFSPYAVCPEGATVYAVINGSSYQMQPTTGISGVICPSGFEVYSCDISFYGKELHSGLLSLVCFYEDKTESVDCCEVYLSFPLSAHSDNGEGAGVNDNELSPYKDNGLGKALMCMLKYDNTEIISEVDDYDTYHPYNTSLLNGTLDYVENINVSDEGYLRYELKSGLNVYGVDAVLIYDAYALPQNSITVESSDLNPADREEFVFRTDWPAPVNVTQQFLNYEVGYESFAFNISKYEASYVDINFYYCDEINNINILNLTTSKLFSDYEILNDSNGNKQILRLYLRNPGAYYGCEISNENENSIKISFKKYSDSSVAGKRIMLDPGHGGISMVGTATYDNTVSESQVTLAIALKTKAYLEQMGAEVIMTRTMDSSLSLSERTYMCESQNPDIFVSIHCDGSDSVTQSGTHTFYFTPFSQPLASSIHKRLVEMYSNSIYVEADENYASIDRKIKFYPFYVTRVDNCPSVLVETGFLSNYVEGYVLSNPVNQDYLGKAIAYGINDFFNLSE